MNQVLQEGSAPIMWVFAFMAIGGVILMTLLFERSARKFAKTHKLLSKDEMRQASRVGAVVAIGPAVAVFIIATAMIAQLGGPLTLMRVGIIGSAPTELLAASIGAKAYGTQIGSEGYNMYAFTASVWTMFIMSSGYLLIVPWLSRGLGKAKNSSESKDPTMMILFATVFPLALFSPLITQEVVAGADRAGALVVGFGVMAVMSWGADKLGHKWMKDWATGFAVVASMLTGTLIGG